jgi:hypothetical protein
MKDLDTLEAAFRTELRAALRRAVQGRSPTLFLLSDNRARSRARALKTKAERILELRRSYSVDLAVEPVAAKYLGACLSWQHVHNGSPKAVAKVARELLVELEHAT